MQLFALVGVVATAYFTVGFEIAVLAAIVIGFSLNTMNVIASATSQNIHLAEIRDLLLRSKNSN